MFYEFKMVQSSSLTEQGACKTWRKNPSAVQAESDVSPLPATVGFWHSFGQWFHMNASPEPSLTKRWALPAPPLGAMVSRRMGLCCFVSEVTQSHGWSDADAQKCSGLETPPSLESYPSSWFGRATRTTTWLHAAIPVHLALETRFAWKPAHCRVRVRRGASTLPLFCCRSKTGQKCFRDIYFFLSLVRRLMKSFAYT